MSASPQLLPAGLPSAAARKLRVNKDATIKYSPSIGTITLKWRRRSGAWRVEGVKDANGDDRTFATISVTILNV